MGFVVSSVRLSAPVRPRRVTVKVSSIPSRRLAAGVAPILITQQPEPTGEGAPA